MLLTFEGLFRKETVPCGFVSIDNEQAKNGIFNWFASMIGEEDWSWTPCACIQLYNSSIHWGKTPRRSLLFAPSQILTMAVSVLPPGERTMYNQNGDRMALASFFCDGGRSMMDIGEISYEQWWKNVLPNQVFQWLLCLQGRFRYMLLSKNNYSLVALHEQEKWCPALPAAVVSIFSWCRVGCWHDDIIH